MTKILLVDDHDLVRAGLKSILESNAELTVISEHDSGEKAIEFLAAADQMPDVVMMDLNMPGMGGMEATKRISHKYPDIKIIVVTALQDNPFPAQLFKLGASGYVTKGCDAAEMFTAIQTVMQGKQYLASEIADKQPKQSAEDIGEEQNPFGKLSDREMQIMLMVTQGMSNQFISDSLFLSPKTISTYRHRLFEKLDISNDVELTHLAIRYGVINQ